MMTHMTLRSRCSRTAAGDCCEWGSPLHPDCLRPPNRAR
jgi:hypothetical protein